MQEPYTPRVRIVHYIEHLRFEDGGPVRAVIDLTEALAAKGHQLSVMAHDIKDAPAIWASDDALPTAHLLPRPTRGPWLASSQLDQARKLIGEADLLHAHGIWVPAAAQMATVARSLNTPYVISIRGMLDDWCMAQRALKKKIYLTLMGSKFLNGAAKIHLTAQAELDQARQYFTAPTTVIPNLMSLEPFEPMPGPSAAHDRFAELLAPGVPVLLFLSRIHYKKGIESLLEASAALSKKGVEHRVLIAGTGEDDYVQTLHARRESLGAKDAHFIGHITGSDKISLYQLADLMVLPTSQENFGFVFFEALAAGTAVLTTKGVDTWPELEASGGGFILPDGQPDQLASRIESLITDRDKLAQAGASGRDWMFKEMNPTKLVERFEHLYQSATG